MGKVITIVCVAVFVVAMAVMVFAGGKAKDVEPQKNEKK